MVKKAVELSDKQIQQTVGSFDKKRKAKSFKNSLAFPYIKTWPAVDVADAKELINLLEMLLPEAKICSPKPVWKDLCKLSKEERKKIKEHKLDIEDQNKCRSLISPGYSAVTRGLEKGALCCCILAEEIEPPILIKNIISLAQNKKVPVVIIPSLKSVLQKTLSFSAMAIGFKVIVDKEPNCLFNPIFKCVSELHTKFAPSEENCLQNHSVNYDDSVSKPSRPQNVTQTADNKPNFYLLKTSPNGPRVFVPPRERENCYTFSHTDGTFIPINKDDTEKILNVESDMEVHFNKKNDEESDDDDDNNIDCDEIFKIDTKPDDLLKTSWEQSNVEPPNKKKNNAKHLLNPIYQPTKIKVIRSNPGKAFKKKKKKKATND